MKRTRGWAPAVLLALVLALVPQSALGLAALDAEPNDTAAEAEWLVGPTSGTLSSSDRTDVYYVPCVAGESLEVRLSHDFASTGMGDFDLYLYEPFGSVAETAPALTFSAEGWPASSEYLRYRIPGAGSYYVVVRAFEATTEAVGYDLTVSLDDVPTPLSGVARYAGANRYLTSVEISRRTFPDGGCPSAVIASGKGFADALSGSGLAGIVNGPLLLTDPAALSIDAWGELSRLGVSTVYIVGGVGAVSDDVEFDLGMGGISVVRIAGATRYDTAVEVANRMKLLGGAVSEAFVVYGGNFPDALAASPVAYAQGKPIILTTRDVLGQSAWDFLVANCGQAYVIGGQGAVSEAVESQASSATGAPAVRLAGADRYATAQQVGAWFNGTGNDFGFVGVATGANYPDALSGGAATGYEGGLLLLTPGSALNDIALGVVRDDMVWGDDAVVFGGEGAVSAAAFATIASEIGLKEP